MTSLSVLSVGRVFVGVVLLAAALSVGAYGFFLSFEHDVSDDAELFNQDTIYVEECGACHMAYPPGLLLADSWSLMLEQLDDHFGDNAELAESERIHLKNYLQRESLRYGKPTKMSRMLRNLPDRLVLRITEMPNFKLDHQNLIESSTEENREEGWLGDCESCHVAAQEGRFLNPRTPVKVAFRSK